MVTPRDDRFFTPRALSNRASSSSEEWVTPRRDSWTNNSINYNNNNNSDADYETPRGIGFNNYSADSTGGYASSEQYNKYRNSSSKPDTKQYKQYGNKEEQTDSYVDSYAVYAEAKERETVALDLDQQDVSPEDVEDIFSYARHGRFQEIERLLDRGVPVNVRDHYGNTVLTTACQNGNKRIAKLALRRGADINARNYRGNTPLHYCCHYGYGGSLGQYLIEKGADPQLRNNEGKVCWDGI